MKYWFTILAVLVALSSCNHRKKTQEEKGFTQIYLDSLKTRHPEVDFKIIDGLVITGSFNESDYQYFLDNAYNEYKAQPDSINSILTRYLNASSQLYAGKSEIQEERIVPIIKPITYLDDLRKLIKDENGEEKEPWIVYEKYNDELLIVYGVDNGTNIAYFSQEDFDKLHIVKDTLLNFSISNMKKLLPEIKRYGDDGVWGITADGNLDASLILLPSLWTKENFDIKGDFIIAIPNRDMLLITGSENSEGIEKFKELVEKSYREGNYSISPYLYKWNGKRFTKYM